MILPGKHLKQDRALLGIGSEILASLGQDQTVSELWERVRERRGPRMHPLSFDWFVLSLSFLYSIGAVDYEHGLISARSAK